MFTYLVFSFEGMLHYVNEKATLLNVQDLKQGIKLMNVKHLHGAFETSIKTKKEHKKEQKLFALSCFWLATTLKRYFRLNPLNRSAMLLMVERLWWWTQIMFHSLHNFHDWLITAMISENELPPIKLLTRWQGIWCKQFSKIKCQFPNT